MLITNVEIQNKRSEFEKTAGVWNNIFYSFNITWQSIPLWRWLFGHRNDYHHMLNRLVANCWLWGWLIDLKITTHISQDIVRWLSVIWIIYFRINYVCSLKLYIYIGLYLTPFHFILMTRMTMTEKFVCDQIFRAKCEKLWKIIILILSVYYFKDIYLTISWIWTKTWCDYVHENIFQNNENIPANFSYVCMAVRT